ncbi:MAG: M20 family metallopeptidase [Acidobacteria bacterium]|nr:M20 family metallopeptidase [Acidobacteriota bacterium]
MLSVNHDRLQGRLHELVEIESPSEDSAAVNRANDCVQRWAEAMGALVTRHANNTHGDVMEVRFAGDKALKPILLLGHLDTVWPMGTLRRMPYRIERDAQGRMRIWGPGTLDMKCGVVMAFEAIDMLREAGRNTPPIILLLNPDEEVGSTVSRPYTKKCAREASAVFVLEPAQGIDTASYKTARKGVGSYKLHVTGVASHAGVDFHSGHSAILELARLLLKVEKFTDLSTGLTVNPGVISGGTRSNVVAAEAWAEVDVRIARMEDASRIDGLFQNLRCEDPACTLTITGGINRPPMERTDKTIKLFEQARAIASGLGFHLTEASTGGGSDGNFTAGIGVPTLDGMGAVGEGAHATHESLLIEHLAPRTLLLAEMIARAE